MRTISYRGELVAVATRCRVYLAPRISALPQGDPELRFIAVMCLFSRDVDTGLVPGPYRSEDAEFYARCVLIADDEFELDCGKPDQELADRFGVPAEQIAAKRQDLASWKIAMRGKPRALPPGPGRGRPDPSPWDL
jgi:hypothetical protein